MPCINLKESSSPLQKILELGCANMKWHLRSLQREIQLKKKLSQELKKTFIGCRTLYEKAMKQIDNIAENEDSCDSFLTVAQFIKELKYLQKRYNSLEPQSDIVNEIEDRKKQISQLVGQVMFYEDGERYEGLWHHNVLREKALKRNFDNMNLKKYSLKKQVEAENKYIKESIDAILEFFSILNETKKELRVFCELKETRRSAHHVQSPSSTAHANNNLFNCQ